MLDFRRVTIEDKDRITKLFYQEKDRGCEYTFGNVFIWRDIYGTAAAFSDDGMCVVRFDKEVGAYLFPIGQGNLKNTVDDLIADSEERGVPFRIIAASRQDIDKLNALYPGVLKYHENRDFAEYVYNSKDLIELSGKKYHGKRNHISNFAARYPDYTFEEITRDNIDEVRAMSDEWYIEYLGRGDGGLNNERAAVSSAFDHFFDLGFKGGFLRAGGAVAAFAIGETINSGTFCVHIEKADYKTDGAYAVINRDFARHFCSHYLYINREDDVGIEGLRKAKLSYHPAYITQKFVVEIR